MTPAQGGTIRAVLYSLKRSSTFSIHFVRYSSRTCAVVEQKQGQSAMVSCCVRLAPASCNWGLRHGREKVLLSHFVRWENRRASLNASTYLKHQAKNCPRAFISTSKWHTLRGLTADVEFSLLQCILWIVFKPNWSHQAAFEIPSAERYGLQEYVKEKTQWIFKSTVRRTLICCVRISAQIAPWYSNNRFLRVQTAFRNFILILLRSTLCPDFS